MSEDINYPGNDSTPNPFSEQQRTSEEWTQAQNENQERRSGVTQAGSSSVKTHTPNSSVVASEERNALVLAVVASCFLHILGPWALIYSNRVKRMGGNVSVARVLSIVACVFLALWLLLIPLYLIIFFSFAVTGTHSGSVHSSIAAISLLPLSFSF